MGIERNDRKPKRRRTTAQRLKGRMQTVFQLPDAPAEAKPAKKNPVATAAKSEKKAAAKTAPKAKAEKKPAKKSED